MGTLRAHTGTIGCIVLDNTRNMQKNKHAMALRFSVFPKNSCYRFPWCRLGNLLVYAYACTDMIIALAARSTVVKMMHFGVWCLLRYLWALAPQRPHRRQQHSQRPQQGKRSATRRPRLTTTNTGISQSPTRSYACIRVTSWVDHT